MLYRRYTDKFGNILFVQELHAQYLDQVQRPIGLMHADYAITPRGRLIKNRSGPTSRDHSSTLVRQAASLAKKLLGRFA